MGNEYVGQFVLSMCEIPAPPGFLAQTFDSWTLYTHKSLPVLGLYTLDNVRIGWAIGHWIDISKEDLLTEKLIVPIASDGLLSREHADTVIDEFFHSFGGRYVCFLLNQEMRRVYVDAGGTMSCVYSVHKPIVASTPGLILGDERYFADIDEELYRSLGMPRKGWYPFGLTAHVSVRRLLPNHYLDMRQWLPVRHWPRETTIGGNCDTSTSIRTIVGVIQSSIIAILKHYPVYLTLTAGRDSRTLLACAKDIVKRIEFVTFVRDAETVDEYIAALLAKRFNLNWSRIPIKHASDEQRNQWLHEVGHCLGGQILDIHQTLGSLQPDYAILPGLGSELHKAHYYKLGDELKNITSAILLRRMNLPPHPTLLDAGDRWLKGVGLTDVSQLLGVAYIEQRLACWGMPQTYGQLAFVNHFFPSVHRSTFTHMLALPAKYKKSRRLTRDMMQVVWPELLDLPFNEYIGLRNWFEKARKIRGLPAKLLKIIRPHSHFYAIPLSAWYLVVGFVMP